jgi:hypothetical protein
MPESCPDKLTLQSLLLGQILGPEGERWETHLETCSACVSTAGTLTLCDPLTQEARQAAAGPPALVIAPAELPVVQGLLERARSLYGPGGPENSATLRPGRLSILEAPRREGELGRLGAYRVVRLLGAGSMGLVFQAEDERLGRAVALKVLHPRLAAKPEARARFLLEARAMAAITHDHIVPVYHVEEAGATPFLAMPLLSGLPLSAWLKRHPRPGLATVLRWGREIASGLAAAHVHGLIHRDVKPSNLWVEAPGERIKILDFGLAYFDKEDVRLTAPGTIVGTPAYMAPEQARGAPPGPRADLFSLGCVLYELCTGVMAFPGDTVLAVLSALANDDPAPVRSLNPGLPIGVEVLVRRLLAKRPEQRPASAREVAETLGRLEAAPAPPPRPTRRRWLAGAAAAVALSVAGGVWWARRGRGTPPAATDDRPERDEKSAPTPRGPDRLVGHTDTVTALAFPAGGKVLASASADGTVRLWELATGAEKALAKHPSPCTALALAADGHTLASCGRDGSVRLDDLDAGKVQDILTEPDGAWGLAFGRANQLYVATEHGVVIWGLPTRHREARFFANHQAARMVAVSPRRDLVVAGTKEKYLFFRFLDVAVGRQHVEAHDAPIHAGVFSPDGKTLATAAGAPDPTVRLWSVSAARSTDKFAPPRKLELHPGGATAVAWSPDGRVIASGGIDGVVEVWGPDRGDIRAEFRHNAPGAAGAVTCLAFSPDGRLLASGGADKVIRLFDVSAFSGPPKR